MDLMETGSNKVPIIVANPEVGSPLNLSHPAPYNNLGVPGALLYDLLYATKSTDCATALNPENPKPNPFFDLVLRNEALDLGSQTNQLIASEPTLVTLWAGNNDILGYCIYGGEVMFTPVETFTGLYSNLSSSLATTNADIFVANIPDVESIPFLTTFGPTVAKLIEADF